VNAGSGNSAFVFQRPAVRVAEVPRGLLRSLALNQVHQHYTNPNPVIARPPPPQPPSPVVSFPALVSPAVLPRPSAMMPRVRTPEAFPKLRPNAREVPALAIGVPPRIAPNFPEARFRPNGAAGQAYARFRNNGPRGARVPTTGKNKL
jgi:hypothetical protein